MDLVLQIVAVVVGCGLLVWGGDRFVVGAANIARKWGVSPLVIGLTIVGFGTSAPEMLVSAIAALRGSTDLSIGNAVGSNITNTALVLGVAALVQPMTVNSKIVRRELPVLVLAMLAAVGLMSDGVLGAADGWVLLLGLTAMIAWVVREGLLESRQSGQEAANHDAGVPVEGMSTAVAVLWTVVGLVVLLGSSDRLVWGVTGIARYVGVDELFIGLTVVAFGTSLPELVASVAAARRGEHDIAVGNVVGSNLFNVLGVLALPGILRPGPFDGTALTRDFPMMIGITLVLMVFLRFLGKKNHLGRAQGTVLVLLFVLYVVYLVVAQRA